MPRYHRQQSPSKIYHVMLRGNEGKNIFVDDEDKARFLDTLKRMKEKDNYYLYSYCLMDNHVHLLIAEGEDSLSRSMKRIGVSYAYYFNRKNGRIGHLFQDRFKSEVIDEDAYLLSAARYIHNNPVKAGMVKNPGDYKWSSYNIYISDYVDDGLIEKERLLAMYSSNKPNAVQQFINFTTEHNDDQFIEYKQNNKKVLGHLEIKEIICEIVKSPDGIEFLRNCKEKQQRRRMLSEIKERTGAPVRELSRIIGISKDIIARA